MYSEIRLDDIDRGTKWWESLSEAERSEWFAKVGTTRPADAWDAFKRSRRRGDFREPELQLTEDLQRDGVVEIALRGGACGMVCQTRHPPPERRVECFQTLSRLRQWG